MNNMGKVMDLVNKFAGDTLSLQREAFDKVINDKDSCWHQLIEKVWTQTDPSVLKTIFNNFFVNANLVGWPKQEEMRKKYGCNIPWAILLDPTSACNLHCTGCWAAEYGNKLNLTLTRSTPSSPRARSWASTSISTPAVSPWCARRI